MPRVPILLGDLPIWQRWVVSLAGMVVLLYGYYLLDLLADNRETLCSMLENRAPRDCTRAFEQSMLGFYVVLAGTGMMFLLAWIFRRKKSN